MMNRANLSRYARWQLQDFLMERGIAIVMIGALLATPEIIMMNQVKGPYSHPEQVLVRITGTMAVIFSLIALNGIVSNDRVKGYFRFLFAKPVSPAAFYAQQLGVWFVALLLVVSLLIGIFAVVAGPVTPWPTLWYVSLVYFAFGGLGFFVSTVMNRDWLAVIGVWSIAQLLNSLYNDGAWYEKLLVVLPPVEHLSNAGKALTRQGMVAAADVAWILGYSAIFFVLGLLVLHRRPFHS